MKTKRSPISKIGLAVTLALAVAVAVAGGTLRSPGPMAVPDTTAAGSVGRPLRFAWPDGTRYRYAFSWTSDSRLHLALGGDAAAEETPIAGTMEIAGQLVLRSYGERDGGYLVGVSFEDLARHRLHVFDKEFLPNARGCERQETLVEIAASGAMSALHFPPGDPDVCKSLVEWLLADAQVVLSSGGAPAWSGVETSTIGEARVVYSADRALSDGAPVTLSRTRAKYMRLLALPGGASSGDAPPVIDSAATIVVSPEGHLVRLADEEGVVVARPGRSPRLAVHTSLRLELSAIEQVAKSAAPAFAWASYQLRRPGAVVVSEDAVQRLLEKRAGGLTIEAVVNDLLTAGSDGQMADHGRWLWRASGLLLLHPESCRELAIAFRDDAISLGTRSLILDLLAQTGHARAQSVLRELLATPEAKNDAAYPFLLQRLALVERPDAATGRFALAAYRAARQSGTVGTRDASALVVGALAGRLHQTGDRELSAALDRRLRDDLLDARSPAEKESLLHALGNATLDEDLPIAVAFAHDDDPAVRRGAAAALRRRTQPEASATLVDLLGDGDAGVQRAAIQALAGHSDVDVATRLGAAIEAGTLRAENDPFAVALLAGKPLDEATRKVLAQILARSSGDPRLAARIRALTASGT